MMHEPLKNPALFVVATPIGNLEDVSLRTISVLNSVDLILAEDTRVTRVLLERYNIQTPLISYHQHSTLKKIESIIDRLKQGQKLALVSDAGTPGISDPGGVLVHRVIQSVPETKIVPIPGPNAAVTALSICGFPTDQFMFLGFPPHKKGRQTFFRELGQTGQTVVFYESKHRLVKALKEMQEISHLGERQILIARELTKQFETIYRGTASELAGRMADKDFLGEFVIVVGPVARKATLEPTNFPED